MNSHLRSLLLLAITFLSASAWAIPSEAPYTGYLTVDVEYVDDSTSEPITFTVTEEVNGSYDFLVTFTDSGDPETNQVLDTLTIMEDVVDGWFTLNIELPTHLLTEDEVWIFASIDLDSDGFTPEDMFDEPIRLTSVPFALSGKPSLYYESHGGQAGYNQFGAQGGTGGEAGSIAMAPFCTPPGGVSFNRMAASFGYEQLVDTTFGVYDSNGNLVYSSPPLNGLQTEDVLAFEIEDGALEPSTIYYSAITSGSRNLRVGIIMLPNIASRGIITNVNTNGILPETVVLNDIETTSDYRPISISFYQVDDESPEPMKRVMGRGKKYEAK